MILRLISGQFQVALRSSQVISGYGSYPGLTWGTFGDQKQPQAQTLFPDEPHSSSKDMLWSGILLVPNAKQSKSCNICNITLLCNSFHVLLHE